MLKGLLRNLLRFGVSAVCLWLAFRGTDMTSVLAALSTVSPWSIAGGLGYVLLTFVPATLRLRMICAVPQPVSVYLRALVIGSGLNNILPARIGEFAKMYYLRRMAGIPFSRGMEIVFWERFSDLNGLLVLALFGALASEKDLAIQALAVGVLGIWGCLAVYVRWADFWNTLLLRLPGKRLWGLVLGILGHLRERMAPGFLLRLSVLSMFVLAMNFGITLLVLRGIGGLPLTLSALVVVFIISQLGLAVPSSPGAIGVYEASVVLPLVGFGVDRGTAFVLAVVLHFIQYVPATLGCIWLMARDRLSVRELQAQQLVEEG